MTDDTLLRIFRTSSLEQLALAEKDLLDLETAAPNSVLPAVEGLFRAIHTLKGDAGTLQFTAVVTLCHELETILDRMRSGRLDSSAPLVTDLLAAFDDLKRTVLLSSPETPADNTDLLARLTIWQQSGCAALPTGSLTPAAVDLSSQPDFDSAADQPPSAKQPEETPPPGSATDGDGLIDESTIAGRTRETIPVRNAELDLLLEGLGEIMLARSRLASLARRDARWEYLDVADDLERQVLDMGKRVLGMRLLPLHTAMPKYRRLVRDVATRAGKNAGLAMSGEFTELDKSVIEKLNTPIIHLLRNAVHHGIEPAEVRSRLGKPAKGEVTINARQDGHDIVIVVRDDGAGISPEAVYAKALAAGQTPPGVELTAQQKLELVFLSGLSTAATVDDISGRGVGLDAVRSTVESLSGQVSLESVPGRGTAFTIRFPVSLTLMECLRVQIDAEVVFFPLEAVVECLELPRTRPSGKAFFTFALRGGLLPLVALDALYGLNSGASRLEQIIVAESNGLRFGVAVDKVLGLCQVMVKALESKMMHAKGFLGAALNDAGGMSLIVDPRYLAQALEAGDEGERGEGCLRGPGGQCPPGPPV